MTKYKDEVLDARFKELKGLLSYAPIGDDGVYTLIKNYLIVINELWRM